MGFMAKPPSVDWLSETGSWGSPLRTWKPTSIQSVTSAYMPVRMRRRDRWRWSVRAMSSKKNDSNRSRRSPLKSMRSYQADFTSVVAGAAGSAGGAISRVSGAGVVGFVPGHRGSTGALGLDRHGLLPGDDPLLDQDLQQGIELGLRRGHCRNARHTAAPPARPTPFHVSSSVLPRPRPRLLMAVMRMSSERQILDTRM